MVQQATREMLSHVEKPLLNVKSFFPFDLFPDSLSINPIEVTFVQNIFFFSSYVISIPVEDIWDISMTKGPFFASLKILPTMTIKDEPISMKWLTWGDARKAHDLLQGLMTLKKQKVDISKASPKPSEIEEISRLGKTHDGA